MQVVEERCERYAAMLYPANAARNRALVNARTGKSGFLGKGGSFAARKLSAALTNFAPVQQHALRCLVRVWLATHASPSCFSPLASHSQTCFRMCLFAEAILLVDVDFAVSRSLADALADEESYSRLMAMLHARCGAAAQGKAWLECMICKLAAGRIVAGGMPACIHALTLTHSALIHSDLL